jgi:hypothetical protein
VRRASIRMCVHTAQKHSVTRTTGVRTLSQCECALDLMRVMSWSSMPSRFPAATMHTGRVFDVNDRGGCLTWCAVP